MAYDENNNVPVDKSNKDSRRNSADLLPMFFRTETNKKFLGATLDTLISNGNLERLNGFIGERDVRNATVTDTYLNEPTEKRKRYNLLPSAIRSDAYTGKNTWSGTYDDLLNQIEFYGGKTNNHDRLFESEYYAWNPLFDFDKFVNYRQYYWLPYGPAPVSVSGSPGGDISQFTVTNKETGAYVFTPNGYTENPTLVLYRGATYKFNINAPGHPFNIKTALTTGIGDRYSSGVENNGDDNGTVTFTVPVNAPDQLYYSCSNHQTMQGRFEIRNTSDDLSINVTEEIIGKATYTSKNKITLTNGMKINFVGDVTPTTYRNANFYVEGVGDEIRLIPEQELVTPEGYAQNAEYEFDIDPFDDTPYDDVANAPLAPDYITINRGAQDRNPWSRYNRWIHKDVIEQGAKYNGTVAVLDENFRATRPILEFNSDLQLYNFGVKHTYNIDLIDTITTDAMSEVEGSIGYYVDSVHLENNMLVSFTADRDITVNSKIFKVQFVEHNGVSRIHLEEIYTPVAGDSILVKSGTKEQGTSWFVKDKALIKGQVKTDRNVSPKFELYDTSGVAFSDETTYVSTTFTGNEIASYNTGTGSNDTVLGFPIAYQNINNVGDIQFNFNWDSNSFDYELNGFFTTVDTASGLIKKNYSDGTHKFLSGWQLVDNKTTRQRVKQIKDTNVDISEINIDCIDNAYKWNIDVVVEYGDNILKNNNGFIVEVNQLKKTYKLIFDKPIPAGTRFVIKVLTDQPANANGFYEPPINLTNNSENNDLNFFTLGSVTDHFRTIFEDNSNITGVANGANNSRDIPNIFVNGSRYVKHKGSIFPAMIHLIEGEAGLINAVRKNARDYNNFKEQFLTIGLQRSQGTNNVREDVDNILYELGVSKTPENSYYYADMAGYGRKKTVKEYTVKTITQNVFGIDNSFDITKIQDRAVYVYLNEEHLTYNNDYVFDAVDNIVTVKRTLAEGDKVTIIDYDTVGNVIPVTPTKLGLYPKYQPIRYTDDTYLESVEVIQGHDGSITKVYGDYRDDLLIELEKRIYNNIKVDYNKTVFDINKHIPGQYRNNNYTRQEFDSVLRKDFSYWKHTYDVDYETNDTANDSVSWSYNFGSFVDQDGTLLPGHWKGIYKLYFDTYRPHSHPWEMLGMSVKPTWWEDTYGPAPYTSGNKILWGDLENGTIKDPSNKRTDPIYARPGLSNNLPVDEYGDLVEPTKINIVKNLQITQVKTPWKFGDSGPAENSWRVSSWYPYAMQIAMALTVPARYFGSLFDTSQNTVAASGNIVYKTTGKIPSLKDYRIDGLLYNNIRFKGLGYHSFISDYEKGQGLNVQDRYLDFLQNTSMNIAYKLGGFANKNRLRVLAESSNPNAVDNSIFLPSENYQLMLRKSNPIDSVRISGIIVEKKSDGFVVRGYDKFEPHFKILAGIRGNNDPVERIGGKTAKFVIWQDGKFFGTGQIVEYAGNYYRTKISHTSSAEFENEKFQVLPELPISGGAEVERFTRFESRVTEIPYGTKFARVQQVYDVILGYGEYLKSQGFVFDKFQKDSKQVQNWRLSGQEFLFWTTQNFNEDSVIALSPFADELSYNYRPGVVDNVLNSFYEYSLLSQDANSLPKDVLTTSRSGGKFVLKTKDSQLGIFFAVLNVVQYEHIIVFDDRSNFGDIIYDQEAGYRQRRIKLIGFKTADWDGDYVSPGFIYDEATITDWIAKKDYNLGDVVRFKNRYYSAKRFLPGEPTFIFDDWLFIGNKPVAELLPNLNYKAVSYEDFYSLENENFDNEASKLAQHLIGYQKRLYLDNLIKDEVSQYKFYQGFIKQKGTTSALNAIQRLNIDGVLNDISLQENWAFKIGSLGSNSTIKEIELPLQETLNVENPQSFEFVSNRLTEQTSSNVIKVLPQDLSVKPSDYNNNPWPQYDITQDGTSLSNVMKLPYAGYSRIEDVTLTLFSKDFLITDTSVPLLDVDDSIWIANDDNGTWAIYRVSANKARLIQTDEVKVSASNNQLTLHTDIPHGLAVNDVISIKDFDSQINGVHRVLEVDDLTTFKIPTTLTTVALSEDSATGSILQFDNVRVGSINDINDVKNIGVLNAGNKIFVDETGSGWAIYEKQSIFEEYNFGSISQEDSIQYGSSIAFGDQGRLIVVGAPNFIDEGSINIIRRKTNVDTATLEQVQGYTISENTSDNLAGGAKPGFGTSVAVSSDGTFIVGGAPNASYVKETNNPEKDARFIEAKINSPASNRLNQGIIKISKLNTTNGEYEPEYVLASQVPTANELFGQQVLVSNERIIVSAPGADSKKGKLYVYDRQVQSDGSTVDWDIPNDQKEIILPNAVAGDQFGQSMAGSKDLEYIVVGIPGREESADLDSTLNSGAVAIYRWNGQQYELLQEINVNTLLRNELKGFDQFGTSVDISDDGKVIIVGAPFSDSVYSNQGKAYIFEMDTTDSTVGIYALGQVITSPVASGGERFGSNVAINPAGTSFAVQGIAGASRVEIPMIDGTTFDSGSMKIVKTQAGSGAVYTYSKLGTKFVFGQNVSSSVLQSNDGFGNGLAYSETSLFIGAPAAVGYKTARTGSLFVYSKNGTAGWNRIREQDSLTNPFSVEKAFTYRTDEQRVIDFLETFDPIKGKIPYLADAEIKFKSTKDPATYTFSNLSTVHVDEGTHWTDLHVGDLWWDLSSVRYLWYEQGDIEYRTNNWGATFPGSSIDIYEWVSTDLTPAEWNEIADTNEGISLGFSGTTKYDENTYTIKRIYDSKTGTFTSRYYYWVRNSAIIPLENQTRKLPASEVARIIENPRAYGIKTLQLLDTNSFSITNIKTTLSDNDVSLSVQYRNVDTDIPQHNEWLIVSPDQDAKIDNELLIKKMIDSLVGFDTDGNAVPDPLLPPQKKYGLQIRPRQTIFVNKQDALKVLIGYVNDLCAKNRIADLKDITRLNDSDPLPNTASGRFDISVDENADLQEIKTQDLIQAKVTANITNGRIKSVNIVEKGFGYKIAPEILISGEGYGAKLKSTINSSGQVTNVEVLKEGRNYTRGILTIRPFKVLVTTDETVGNSWTMYEWNNTEWIRTNTQIYNVRSFWEYKDYIITGFSTDEIIDFKITAPYELKTINPDTGNLIEIANGGDNNKMILRKVESNGTFNDDYDLMYKQNATIKFKDSIFNYARDSFGYAGDENYDTNLFDQQPNDETRIIFNTIKDYIFVDDLKYAWNELFFIALRYSISEQGFLDWAFKTSLINVRNNLGGFSRKVNYNIADPGYLEEYVKEIKPYSSTIKEYVVGYDQLEKSSIGTTDFDLPSYYDDNEQKFKVVGLTDSKITEQPYINWFNNYKFNVARISISDPGEGYTQTPIIIVSGGRESKPIITETAPYDNVVDTDYDNIYVYVASSGIPNHFYNTTGVETQSFVFQIPRLSTVDTENKIPTPLGSIGVARNGVPFYNAVAVETQRLGGTEYTLNSVFSQIENGVEDGSGRLGLDGVYNYHADPKLMYEKDPTVHSPILGFAFDGHPIYGPYGYTNSNDKTIKIQTSSYKLRSISRADGSTPDGRYIEDFEYVNGSGDLDEYNGRFIVTPEYPNGTYAYFVTVDPADTTKPVYPYIIGSEYHGTPILPNSNASMPDSDNIPAQAEALISRSSVGSIVLTNPGAGYTKAPTITITGGGGTVTRTAKATAILENNRIRTSKTDLKFDRLQSKKTIQTEQASDTFTSTAGQLKYKLTFLPTLDKRQFTIDINNETLYIENFDIQIVDVPNKTYAKKEGYVVFKTPATTKSTVVIKYKKNIELMHAVDRINYYYSPTEGMPGKDPAQLMSGIEFPGVEVQGLDFGVSVGFDGLPWFSHGWDTFSGNNTDYAFRADGNTNTFTLPYVPENNVKLNVYFDGVRQDTPGGGVADPEYNNGALIAENNGTVFDRALTVNGLKLVVAGAVGGQLAVPDEWAKKTARTFELMTDPNGAGINTTHQRNFLKTLKGDVGTKHAGIPTVQRVGYGGGSTYTPNWLEDAGIPSYAGLQAFNDSVAQKDMVWYKNINGNNPPTQRRDIEEIFEHIFHTIHAFGIPGAVSGSSDAVEMNPDIRIGNEPSFDWKNTALHLAMKEAIDAGLYDPSGYATDWNTDPEAAAVAYTEYTYLVNWSMWDMSVYWDGGSLSPEWDDSLKTPAGMLANNPLGYALFNTYFAPVISKPNFATIESIFGENDTGVSGYVVDVQNTPTITADGNTDTFTLNTTPQDGVLVVFRQQDSDGSTIPTDVNNLDTIIQGGTFAYNTATGQRPEDISLDGDGFVTPDTSHAPEEVLPGQCFDTLSLQIYNAPADGSPIIETTRYFGDGTTRTYNFNRLPGTEDSIFVTVAGTYYTRTDDVSVTNRYSVNYNTKTITFPEEESAPNDGDMVTIQTLNVSGSNILERKQYTGDGSTTEFLLTSRYGDVKSVFATVNGVSKDYVLREDAGTGSTIVDLVNPPVESNAVIQLTGLSGVEKTFSEIKTDIFTTDGSTTEFALTQTPDKIEPFHAMAVVEIDGKRLRAPDTVYYVSNGITLDYLVSQDPSYPAFSLALGELEVHQNGVRLVPIADYQFNTATNLLTFYSGSLKSGDVIAITILRNHDYEIRKENDDDSTGAGKLIIRSNAFGDSTSIDGVVGSEIRITTFTNHDSNLMRKEVFTGNLGGNYTMSRKTVDSNYVWVELNGNPLVADIDYKVLDDGITVYIDNRLSQTETDIVVITSFQENISHDSVGYKVFKDMLNRSHFKRLSLQDTTKLSAILNLTDTEIKVVDASFLPDPDVAQRIPGVIFIGQERIEYYKKDGNTLKQITRGTLGTSTKDTYSVGTRVDDQGQTQTIPYKETTNVFEVIVRDGLPNGKKIHILETMNFATGANAHDQVEVYVAGRKLQKPTVSSNGITKHDPEIAYDSDELNSLGVASDVTQVPEFTIEPVEDSDVKAYYKLTLRDEPENGMEVKVIQRQGKVWYGKGVSTASNGQTLQRANTPQSDFLLQRPSGLPVINIKE